MFQCADMGVYLDVCTRWQCCIEHFRIYREEERMHLKPVFSAGKVRRPTFLLSSTNQQIHITLCELR